MRREDFPSKSDCWLVVVVLNMLEDFPPRSQICGLGGNVGTNMMLERLFLQSFLLQIVLCFHVMGNGV